MCMAENFTSRRHGGPEDLTIFASSRRQTLGSVFACSPLLANKCRRSCKAARQIDHRAILNGQWETAEKLKSKSG